MEKQVIEIFECTPMVAIHIISNITMVVMTLSNTLFCFLLVNLVGIKGLKNKEKSCTNKKTRKKDAQIFISPMNASIAEELIQMEQDCK